MGKLKVAVLGIGEAGSAIAADLAQGGAAVLAYDPAQMTPPPGVELSGSPREAVQDADLVLSINLPSVALEVAQSVSPALSEGKIFADLNTASPRTKRLAAAAIAVSGALFADVALLAPVPGRGLRTPALACGPGARRFAEWMSPFGMPVTFLDGEIGAASARKLVRSIFMKGLAAAVIESLEAAERLDCQTWSREQISSVLAEEAWIDRLVTGSQAHAGRRIHEMEAARELLAELGVEPYITTAAIRRLEVLQEKS